jgi:hypothetical protein
MIKGLAQFLKERKDEIMKKVRTNVQRKVVGYSEYTQWETTVSFDEIEVVDFDKLMTQIEAFEKSFEDRQKLSEPYTGPQDLSDEEVPLPQIPASPVISKRPRKR